MNPRQCPQEIPTAITLGVVPRVFQLFAGPKDSPFCTTVKSLWIKQGPLIVITQQADGTAVDHRIQAFTRVWTVANNITQAVNFLNGLLTDMRKNGLKSLVIAMDVTDNGAF